MSWPNFKRNSWQWHSWKAFEFLLHVLWTAAVGVGIAVLLALGTDYLPDITLRLIGCLCAIGAGLGRELTQLPVEHRGDFALDLLSQCVLGPAVVWGVPLP